MLLLLTHRDDTSVLLQKVDTLLAELDRDAIPLPLRGLTHSEIVTYLSTRGCPEPDAELLSLVGTVTQGNPLHLRSLVGHNQTWRQRNLRRLSQAITHAIGRLPDLDRHSPRDDRFARDRSL